MNIEKYLHITTDNEQAARRGFLLNVLLFGIAAATILMLLVTLVAQIFLSYPFQDAVLLYTTGPILVIGIWLIYRLNRSGRQVPASYLFLGFLLIVLAFSDDPVELVDGRSLVVFFLPVIMASMILEPVSAFVVATISTGIIILVGILNAHGANAVGIVTLFIGALMAWLSSRSLENALQDLRIINRELDQRVEERTRDLAEALSENQAILESIADGVLVFDNQGQIEVANPAMGLLVGQPSEAVVGLDMPTLMGEAVKDQSKGTIVAHLTERDWPETGIKFEWGERTLAVRFALIHDDVGRTTGTVAVFRDFTREAEIDRMKDSFISMVSHELRTPLNAILGYTDMLKEGVYGPMTEEQYTVTDRIMANTGKLLGLVNNLLDQAQFEAGRLKLNILAFKPSELLSDVSGVMSILAHTKGLELESEIDDTVPAMLFSDSQRLRQILINLVSNAIKFTPQGLVGMRVSMLDSDRWMMEVYDTGMGIPEEAQDMIFEPFQQVDNSITRKYSGAGLGLSIVRQLITLMGGTIDLHSRVGEGSKFTIILPMKPPEEEEDNQ